MNKKSIITLVVVGLVMGGIGFFAGTKVRSNQPPRLGQFPNRSNFTNQQSKRMGNPGGGLVMGEITSLDAQSITVKTVDGSSKIVIISNGTTYQHTTTAALTDLVVGKKITITGIANTDGSLTAKTITLGDNSLTPPPQN